MHTNVMVSPTEVFRHVSEVLAALSEDADGSPIGYETRLGDTGLDSICIAYFIGDLQVFYGLGDALYKRLIVAGLPLLEVRVSELVEFILGDLAPVAVASAQGAA